MWITTVAITGFILCGASSIKLWFEVRALKRALAEPPPRHSIEVAKRILDHERRLKNLEQKCS